MIETIITEIVDAEKQAEKIISDANEKAKDISLSLHSEAEALKKEYALLIKEEVDAIMKAAELEAEASRQEQEKLTEATATNVIKSSEKNIQRTVEWLADLIVKQNA